MGNKNSALPLLAASVLTDETLVLRNVPDIGDGPPRRRPHRTLCASGESTIHNIGQIDRGYERLDARLATLGAAIERVED
ncbi:MAG: hypothetical protein OXG82_11990 [Gammaproteobacteria bacterium]|nr:hypothetical protein [Gammaproteobacteria bacterium]